MFAFEDYRYLNLMVVSKCSYNCLDDLLLKLVCESHLR